MRNTAHNNDGIRSWSSKWNNPSMGKYEQIWEFQEKNENNNNLNPVSSFVITDSNY